MLTAEIESARRELRAALPATTTWWINGASLSFDFGPLRRPPESARSLVADDEILDLGIDPAELILLGSQDYAGGAQPEIVLSVRDATVLELDLEYNSRPLRFLNSGPAQFAKTFAALDAALQHRQADIGGLPDRLRELDPEGFLRSEWRLLLDALR